MHYLLIALSVFSGSAKSSLSKILNPYSSTPNGFGVINSVISTAAAFLVLTLSGGRFRFDMTFSLALGTLFGLCLTAAQFCYMRAFAYGKISVVTFIYSCGFLLPTAAGTVFWSEQMSFPVLVGCILLPVSFVLCAQRTERETGGRQDRFRWKNGLFYAFSAMLCSGLLGILQKLHQFSGEKEETGTFLCTAFLVSAAVSGIIAVFPYRQARLSNMKSKPIRALCAAVVCGVCIGTANHINLVLAGELPAAIFFPVVNGGVVVLTALIGRIVFRENLSKTAFSGIILGIFSIVLIGINK